MADILHPGAPKEINQPILFDVLEHIIYILTY